MVGQIMDRLRELVYGQSLAGAGGGGFYFALLKDPSHIDAVRQIVESESMTFYAVKLDRSGIIINGRPVEV